MDGRCTHVRALQDAPQGRQGAPLLERGGERARPRGPGRQRPVLYLGETNDSQRAAWRRSIAVLDETAGARLARSGYALPPKARGGDSLILIVAKFSS